MIKNQPALGDETSGAIADFGSGDADLRMVGKLGRATLDAIDQGIGNGCAVARDPEPDVDQVVICLLGIMNLPHSLRLSRRGAAGLSP